MTFTVSRSGDSTGRAASTTTTEGVTATSGMDFAPASGMLSFPTGVTTRTLTVDVTGDRLDESDEVLVVNLSNPTGGHIVDGQGQGTITDDDSSPMADSQSVATDEDTALPVTLAATDADGDPLTYTMVNAPGARHAHRPRGEPDVHARSRTTTVRTASRSRRTTAVNDSNLATVSITVNPVNDAPVASRATRRCSPRTASRSCRCRRPTPTAIRSPTRSSTSPHTARSRAPARAARTRRPRTTTARLVHVQGERRHRRLEHRDGLPHRPAGERCAGRGQRHGDRRRGRLDRGRRARERLGRRRRRALGDVGRRARARHRGAPGATEHPLHARRELQRRRQLHVRDLRRERRIRTRPRLR